MMLNPNQLDSFESNGFLIIPDFVDSFECEKLITEANTLVDTFDIAKEHKTIFSTVDQERSTGNYFMDSGDKVRFFFEPNAFLDSGELRQTKSLSINKIGHALHDLNPVFNNFSRNPALASICNQIGFQKPILMQSMYIFKQPRIGGEVSCHQDATFLYTDPMSVVGFWFALQDATLTNGCMYALPGGHKLSLKRRFRRNHGEAGGATFDEIDITPIPTEGFVPLEAKKGSLVLLHGLLPHLSGPNLSDFSRHAYTLHVIDGTTTYPKDNWLQRSSTFPARGF